MSYPGLRISHARQSCHIRLEVALPRRVSCSHTFQFLARWLIDPTRHECDTALRLKVTITHRQVLSILSDHAARQRAYNTASTLRSYPRRELLARREHDTASYRACLPFWKLWAEHLR